ncbi:hypothetical protein INT43_007188 [Umbelopsis isabellina]|uniref:Uncharacterized protein n=1 Tax=Mortierella isabellina TaxID=91625 RepID=A0A8H7PY45_MORIS|nr:hypothetical protein INT43_007188 [Umbelopsis isabellina]
MDPGYKLLQKLKQVPNLVNEDPSIITPLILTCCSSIQTNTSFMDMPWSDFSKLLAQQNRRSSSSTSSNASSNEVSSEEYDEQDINDDTLGNWDAQTGYQEGGKIVRQH